VTHNGLDFIEGISLGIKTKFGNLCIPTEESHDDDDDDTIQFYKIMERACDSISNDDVKVVIGDLNVKLG